MFWVLYLYGGGLDWQVEKEFQRIQQQVAKDFEKQYFIAKRNGSAIDAYTQAMLVATSYLQANDEANYRKWKNIAQQEGKREGKDF